MSTDAGNLSGLWKGIFNYPRLLPPNQFDAEMRDHLGVITGETFEYGDAEDSGRPMHAMIEGHRSGSEVNFVKRYDDLRAANWPVHYSGTIADDGNEISGNWEIRGVWSGTFIMIRAKRADERVESEVAEPVD